LLKHNIEEMPPFFRILRYIVQPATGRHSRLCNEMYNMLPKLAGVAKTKNILQRTSCFIANFLL